MDRPYILYESKFKITAQLKPYIYVINMGGVEISHMINIVGQVCLYVWLVVSLLKVHVRIALFTQEFFDFLKASALGFGHVDNREDGTQRGADTEEEEAIVKPYLIRDDGKVFDGDEGQAM